jgi:hypothetical protein
MLFRLVRDRFMVDSRNMFGRDKKVEPTLPVPEVAHPLKDALREARIEAAERAGVVVDLRDAELARLELLNEALDPLFAEIPASVDLFDRGISRGDVPRLWIDVIAHVEMGRDKRQYRLLQDTRYGRTVLAESHEIGEINQAVTQYVARRLVEREHALADDAARGHLGAQQIVRRRRWRRGSWAALIFVLGALAGVAVLFALAMLNAHS